MQLRKAVKGKRQVEYEKKPALYAKTCDSCGKVFDMESWCNDENLASLHGTFDKCASHGGKSLGNQFRATACSFACAENLFNGGWKNMKEFSPYKRVKAALVRAELKITALIKTEDELIKEWEDA